MKPVQGGISWLARSVWLGGGLLLVASLVGCSGGGDAAGSAGPAPSGPTAPASPSLALLAGGLGGGGGLEGIGNAARFGQPMGAVVDSQGNVFVADAALHVVRKVTPEGQVTDFAGQRGVSAVTLAADPTRALASPSVLAIDAQDNLYVGGDSRTYELLRKITPQGVMTKLPRSAWPFAVDASGLIYSMNGGALTKWPGQGADIVLAGGSGGVPSEPVDGVGAAATFTQPVAIAVDGLGNVYLTDVDGAAVQACQCEAFGLFGTTVRKVTPQGVVTTLAGRWGETGQVDGTGAAARFSGIRGLAIDRDGSLLVADARGHTLRRVSAAGVVTTVAGLAGQSGSVDGPLAEARLNQPMGVAVGRDGKVWVTEAGNFTLRRIDAGGQVTTVAGRPAQVGSADGRGDQARFNGPLGLAVDATTGTVYVADTGNHVIRRIARDGATSTLAGLAGQPGWVDGAGVAARFNAPTGLVLQPDGGLLVADHDNRAIRRIDPGGQVSTLADLRPMDVVTGGGTYPALPRALALLGNGTLLVADDGTDRILARAPDGSFSVAAGHRGTFFFHEGVHDGSGEGATFNSPSGLAVSRDGLIYVADQATVRKITPDRWVSTFVGDTPGYANGLGIQALFSGAVGVAVDDAGIVLVADRFNRLVRRITPTATVTSYVGTPGEWGVRLGSSRPSLGEVMGVAIGPQGIVILSENAVLVATP